MARLINAATWPRPAARRQIDVGFGDAVTLAPWTRFCPVLLDGPARLAPAHLSRPYAVIAEKLHAIALLGDDNSRMKDCLDLSVLLQRETLAPDLLAQAGRRPSERSTSMLWQFRVEPICRVCEGTAPSAYYGRHSPLKNEARARRRAWRDARFGALSSAWQANFHDSTGPRPGVAQPRRRGIGTLHRWSG